MPYKNKKNYIKHYKDYYNNNKEKIKKRFKNYFKKNRTKISNNRKENYKKSGYLSKRKYYIRNRLKCISGNLPSWKKYFQKSLKCPLCNKKIYFNSGKRNRSFTFDHRNEGKELIKISPMQWLKRKKRTIKNERIWEACDFGILCFQCNKSLPTKDRRKWVQNLMNYTYGKC